MKHDKHNRSQTITTRYRPFKTGRLLVLTLLLTGISIPVHAETSSPENNSTENNPPETGDQQTSGIGKVARAMFTSQIVDREPADQLTEMSNDSERIYFFTDLRGLAGQIVRHQWEYAGKIMANVKFKVGNDQRWRVYSSKNLLPTWTGEWTVNVFDESGSSLNVSRFTYNAASMPDHVSDQKPESGTPNDTQKQ